MRQYNSTNSLHLTRTMKVEKAKQRSWHQGTRAMAKDQALTYVELLINVMRSLISVISSLNNIEK